MNTRTVHFNIPGTKLADIERVVYRAAYAVCEGNTRLIAAILGASRRTVQYKIKQYDLHRSETPAACCPRCELPTVNGWCEACRTRDAGEPMTEPERKKEQ